MTDNNSNPNNNQQINQGNNTNTSQIQATNQVITRPNIPTTNMIVQNSFNAPIIRRPAIPTTGTIVKDGV